MTQIEFEFYRKKAIIMLKDDPWIVRHNDGTPLGTTIDMMAAILYCRENNIEYTIPKDE